MTRVLVTGARRGIGASAAVGLSGPGVTMVLHHLGAESEISDVVRRCRDEGADVVVLEADLADPEGTLALADAAGEIDVLVNNAARSSNVDLDDLTLDEWWSTFNVNVTAAMLLTQRLSHSMRQRGWGRVINVTSATVRLAGPSGGAYIASKAALVGLTRRLARELGAHGVTVNAVSPGAIRTESETELHGHIPSDEIDRDVLVRQAVQRRLVADDLVGIFRFLASRDSDALTGQVIEVGGGLVYR